MPEDDDQADGQVTDAYQPSTDPEQQPDMGTPDWKAEAEKWKQLARKHETAAKANARQLDDLRKTQMTDSEKALADAEQRGRSSAFAEVGQRIAAAELRAALTGIVPNPSAIIEDLNLAKYLTDEGEVDQQAVAALRAKYAAFAAPGVPPTPAPGGADGGPRGNPAGTITREQLKTMTPEAITKAHKDGLLDHLLTS